MLWTYQINCDVVYHRNDNYYVCQRLRSQPYQWSPKFDCIIASYKEESSPEIKTAQQHYMMNVPQAAKCVSSLPSSNLEFEFLHLSGWFMIKYINVCEINRAFEVVWIFLKGNWYDPSELQKFSTEIHCLYLYAGLYKLLCFAKNNLLIHRLELTDIQ